jgi:hypothetical protein
MHELEPVSLSPAADRPRHAHQEVVDLLAAGILRLSASRRSQHEHSLVPNRDEVGLGFPASRSVNANPDHDNGVRQ